jgi:hypothetical protein
MTESQRDGGWFYTVGGERKGPVGFSDLEALVRAGVIHRDTLVWTAGRADWKPAVDVPELSALVSAVIPPVPPSAAGAAPGPWAGGAPDEYDGAVASYRPEAFKELFTWFWICIGPGMLLCFPAIAGIVLSCILRYRFWAVIQKGGGARTTPGLAVGLLFVPLFNFYWQFVSTHGLAQDMNAYCRRNNIPGQVNESMALAICILSCLSVIPYVGIATALAALILHIVMFSECSTVAAAIVRSRNQKA